MKHHPTPSNVRALATRFLTLLRWAALVWLLAGNAGSAPADEPHAAADPPQAVAAQPGEASVPAWSEEELRFFETRIRPLLAVRCFECHGEKKQEYGLRLDSRAAVLAGSDDGPVAVPGKPDDSPLMRAVRYGGDIEMPPDDKLSDDEIDALAAWVRMGLPWPAEGAQPVKLTGDALYRWAREHHWAFQPIREPPLPEMPVAASTDAASTDAASTDADGNPASTNVDRFVVARLEAAGMTIAPAADKRTLIRRATFDLHGLPPTPEEVAEFLADERSDAYARLIERLLASPRYGERWGRHWLDVARYSDTRGYSFGRERRFPYAYTYRDYVIAALNADLPFDRFVIEQVAADRLELGDDKRPLAALGFLTVGRRFDNRPDDVDDRIDTLTQAFLGLTVSCARCHDHKYDPIPTEDYYSLYGVLASAVEPKEMVVIGSAAEVEVYDKYLAELKTRQGELDAFVADRHAKVIEHARENVVDYLVRVATNGPERLLEQLPFISLGERELKPKLIERWRAYIGERGPDDAIFGPWHRLLALPDEDYAEAARQLAAELAGNEQFNPRLRASLAADPPATKADVARVYGTLLRDVLQQGDRAAAKAADGEAAPAETQQPMLTAGTDELRKVLAADNSPINVPRDDLRSYLLRADRNQFGELQKRIDEHNVRSPGAPPRAMMVVDADRPFDPYVFIRGSEHRHGPKVPRQFLRIVAGDDRKPFSEGSGRLELAQALVDPSNPLTARVIVNRVWQFHFGEPLVETPSDFGLRSTPPSHPELLDWLAWHLRQNNWSLKWLHRQIMQSAAYRQAGTHRPECAAVDPENRLLWRYNRRRLEFEPLRDSLLAVAGRLDLTAGGRPVDLLTQPFSTRRSIYGLIDRQDLPNLLRVFDFASPDQSTARRPETTVPQQALFLMNSPFAAEQARHTAARLDSIPADQVAERIVRLYQLVYQRDPSAEERMLGEKFVAAAGGDAAVWAQYAQALLMANEFVYVD